MVRSVKRNLFVKKKNKVKNNKLQYVLTIEPLLKTGFHLGGDQQFGSEKMNPFIIGKSKTRSRFKIATKKNKKHTFSINSIATNLGKKSKKLQNKNFLKSLKQKRLSQTFIQINGKSK
jgi:hypothetical protein